MSSQIINLSLPEELVRKIDIAADADYSSRSEFIRRAVVSRLNAQERLAWETLEGSSKEISDSAERLGLVSNEAINKAVKDVRKSKKHAR